MTARTDRRRSDAYANESRIIAAAREIFATDGAAATLTQVAARAGVGNATLYRHFPNRQALAAAVYEDVFATEIEPVILELVDRDAPREAFIDVIERIAELMYAQRPLLPSLDHLTELTSRLFGRKREILEAVVRRGQEVGELRADLTVEDVSTFVAMVTAASVALEQPAALRRRYLSLMLDALNPADAQPLPPLPDQAP